MIRFMIYRICGFATLAVLGRIVCILGRRVLVVLAPASDETICRYGPLQRDERAALGMTDDEATIQGLALLFQYPDDDFHTSITQHLYAAACDL